MKLNDAIYNWLQIKVVAEARPKDQAAQETYAFFSNILKEEYDLQIEKVEKDDTLYKVFYVYNGEEKLARFSCESVDYLLESIENEPKFNLEE